MARPDRSALGDRLRAALQEPQERATSRYEEAFFSEGVDQEDADQALDDLGIATDTEQASARDRGEVFGALTGRAERSIQAEDLTDVRWDATRAYPQIQTSSINPERPRTIAAGYDPNNAIIRVTFRNGSVYEYLGVSPRIWSTFQRAPSPGQYINQVLNQYPYRPALEDR